MSHNESRLQMMCVEWFAISYPQYRKLLFHVKNEESGGRVAGAIHKAEGVVSGVADLMLGVPAEFYDRKFTGLAIEMKTETGRQSTEQKVWQKMYEASGGRYIVVRSLDEFTKAANSWLMHVDPTTRTMINDAYRAIEAERKRRDMERFTKITRCCRKKKSEIRGKETTG